MLISGVSFGIILSDIVMGLRHPQSICVMNWWVISQCDAEERHRMKPRMIRWSLSFAGIPVDAFYVAVPQTIVGGKDYSIHMLLVSVHVIRSVEDMTPFRSNRLTATNMVVQQRKKGDGMMSSKSPDGWVILRSKDLAASNLAYRFDNWKLP